MSALYDFWKSLQTKLSGERNARASDSGKANEHFLKMKDMELFTVFLNGLLPDPDVVLQKAGLTAATYYDLMADSHVAGSVMQRKSRVKRMKLTILSGKPGDAKADAARDMVEEQFSKIERLPEVVNEILDAPFYGATYLELFYNRLPITSDRPNGQIVLQNVMAKPFEWFVYNEDGILKAKSVNQSWGFDLVDLPPNKFVAVVNEGSYRNPYGERAAKRCFWPYQFKKGGLRFWAEFLEKYGMPFLRGKMNSKASDTDLTNFHNDLAGMIRNGVVVTRSEGDETIDVIEANGKASSTDAYKSYKNSMNIEISKAILGETLTIENSESGSQAATETHLTVLESIQDEDRAMVERTLKKIGRIVTDLNFGVEVACPVMSLIDQKELNKDLAERDGLLTEKIGVRFTEDYIARAYRLKEDDFEIVEPAAPGALGQGFPAGDGEGEGEDREPAARPSPGAAQTEREGAQGRRSTFQDKGGAQEFGEAFTLQKGIDKFIDGSIERMSYLSDDLKAKISEILKTSETYEEMTVRLATLNNVIDASTFAKMFSDSLNIAYYVGDDGVRKGLI